MSEFTQLERSVVKQAHQRGEKAVDRAKRRLESEYESKLEDRREQMTAQYQLERATMRRELEQQTQQLQNKRRLLSLEAKQNILDELFAAAIQEMNHGSRDEQLTFLYKVLEKYHDQEMTVKFGEYTRQHLNDEDIHALYYHFPQIKIAEDVILRQGGFVITQDRIDYNYLYAKLVEATQKDLSLTIASQIFGKD